MSYFSLRCHQFVPENPIAKKKVFREEFVVENHVNWKFQVKQYLSLSISFSPCAVHVRANATRARVSQFIVVARICSKWNSMCIAVFMCLARPKNRKERKCTASPKWRKGNEKLILILNKQNVQLSSETCAHAFNSKIEGNATKTCWQRVRSPCSTHRCGYGRVYVYYFH